MSRYVVVSSLVRGSIDPPELVQEDTQARLQEQDAIANLPKLPKCDPFANERVHWRAGFDGIPRRLPQQYVPGNAKIA